MKIRVLILIIMTILLSSFVFAEDFISLIQPIKNNIVTDENAEFKLYVTNTQEIQDIIKIRFNDLYWDIQSKPLYHYYSGINIKPGETIESIIYFQPTNAIGIGRYNVGLDILSTNTGTRVTKPLTINVKPLYPEEIIGEYSPEVDVTAQVPEKVDPRKTVEIKVNLKNRNPLNITDLSVQVEGSLFGEYRETVLPPLFEKTEEFSFEIDDRQIPTKEQLTITVKRGDDILRVIKKHIDITSYSNLLRDYDEKQEFMKKQRIFIVTNEGNIEHEDTTKISTNNFKKRFQKTEPEAKIIKEYDGINYQWTIVLAPNESAQVIITTDYKPLLYLTILILLLIAGYFVFRNEIVITKVGTTISMKEGGASEIKVLVYVKNRSRSFVQNLNIVDRIPNLAEVSSDHTLGALRPTKVLRHEKKGTLMKWSVETIESQEERILSYKIITKLSILGKFNLPPVIVKFNDKKGNERIAKSNSCKV